MSALLLALAGDSDSAEHRLLEFVEDWHDAQAWGRTADMTIAVYQAGQVGRETRIPALLDAVIAWHEFDTRLDSCDDVHGLTRDGVNTDILVALWTAIHGTVPCEACVYFAEAVTDLQHPAEGEKVCADHLRSVCARCLRMHVVWPAVVELDGRGYCHTCEARGARHLALVLGVAS